MININLLPPELKLKRIQAKKNASLFSVCIVITLVFIVLGVIATSAKETIQNYLGASQNNVQTSNKSLDGSKSLEELALFINDRAQTSTDLTSKKAVWSQILQDLANNVPLDVKFNSLNADTSKSPNFTLAGETTTDREIIKFKEKLEMSQFFKNVSFKNSTMAENTLSFSLDFDLEKFSSNGTTK